MRGNIDTYDDMSYEMCGFFSASNQQAVDINILNSIFNSFKLRFERVMWYSKNDIYEVIIAL